MRPREINKVHRWYSFIVTDDRVFKGNHQIEICNANNRIISFKR